MGEGVEREGKKEREGKEERQGKGERNEKEGERSNRKKGGRGREMALNRNCRCAIIKKK